MLRGDDARIGLALFEDAVLIDRGVLAIGYPNDMDPFTGLDGLFEVASHSFMAHQIENIEADPIWSGRHIGTRRVVHSECPLVLAVLALAHPMDVSRAFSVGKSKDVRPHPC
jgi:hypothetical protein